MAIYNFDDILNFNSQEVGLKVSLFNKEDSPFLLPLPAKNYNDVLRGVLMIHVYDEELNFITSDENFRSYDYDSKNSSGFDYQFIKIDLEGVLNTLGISNGNYKICITPVLHTIALRYPFLVTEISSSRDEIRLKLLPDIQKNNPSYQDIYKTVVDILKQNALYECRFQKNEFNVIINAAYDIVNDSLVLKLYDALSDSILENSVCEVVELLTEPIFYYKELYLPTSSDTFIPKEIAPPNFELDIETGLDSDIDFESWETILNSIPGNRKEELLYKIKKEFGDINLNVDFTNFANFVFFGSAAKRIENFYDKVCTIENYQNIINSASLYTSSYAYKESELDRYKKEKQQILDSFDDFESLLYFTSGSVYNDGESQPIPLSYPKSNSTYPYTLHSYSSSVVINWKNTLLSKAREYDRLNRESFYNSLPRHVTEDKSNIDFINLINLVGQYFDNQYSFIKALELSNKIEYNKTESLSKDLTYDYAKNLGLELFSGQSSTKLWEYFLGIYEDGTPIDNKSATFGLPKAITLKDVAENIWRRISNDLPFIYKSKGTLSSVNSALRCYGIEPSFIRVREHGFLDTSDDYEEIDVTEKFSDALPGVGIIRRDINYNHSPQCANEYPTNRTYKTICFNAIFLPNAYNQIDFYYYDHFNNNSFHGRSTINIFKLYDINYRDKSAAIQVDYIGGGSEVFSPFPFYNGKVWVVFIEFLEENVKFSFYCEDFGRVVYKKYLNAKFTTFFTYNVNSSTQVQIFISSVSISIYSSNALYIDRYFTEEEKEAIALAKNSFPIKPSDIYYHIASGDSLYNINTIHIHNHDYYTHSRIWYPPRGKFIKSYTSYVKNPKSNISLSSNKKIIIEKENSFSYLSPEFSMRKQILGIDSNKVSINFSTAQVLDDNLKRFLPLETDLSNYFGNPKDLYEEKYQSEDFSDLKKEKVRVTKSITKLINYLVHLDSSLFNFVEKLLPARSKVNSGISVESPFIERNKVKWLKPEAKSINPRKEIDASNSVEPKFKKMAGGEYTIVHSFAALSSKISKNEFEIVSTFENSKIDNLNSYNIDIDLKQVNTLVEGYFDGSQFKTKPLLELSYLNPTIKSNIIGGDYISNTKQNAGNSAVIKDPVSQGSGYKVDRSVIDSNDHFYEGYKTIGGEYTPPNERNTYDGKPAVVIFKNEINTATSQNSDDLTLRIE